MVSAQEQDHRRADSASREQDRAQSQDTNPHTAPVGTAVALQIAFEFLQIVLSHLVERYR